MKLFNTLFMMTMISGASSSLAQPSDETVAARLKSAGALEVKFTSPHGTVHTLPHEKYYERTTESKWKTTVPGIYRWERVDNRYDFTGGSWSFTRSYFGGSWYDGIPNPTEKEIIALLETSRVGYQGAVMERPMFKLSENPKWNWHTFNSVEFNLDVTYLTKISYSEVAKIRTTIPVRIYRDCGGGQYNPNAEEIFRNSPWLNVQMSHFPSTDKDVRLEVRKLSEAQINSLMNMEEMDEAIANENRKKAWNYTVPAFSSDQDAIMFVHKIMWEGNKDQIEWMAYTLFDKYYFEDTHRTLMNASGKQLLENMLKIAPDYMYLYCEFPEIKHQQTNMLQFYDREQESFGRIAVTPSGDSYLINALDCLFEPGSDKIERCKTAGITGCGTQPEATTPVSIPTFSIGDPVTVNWNGQGKDFYTGKIVKQDPYDANRYFVEFDDIQSAWINASFIQARGAQTAKASGDFEVGQRIQGNWKGQGRWYPGKIAEIDKNSGKYLVRYDDGDQEWTTKEYLK